jgi:isopentenyl-diphosphate delta-isomerase|tara:strand:+ start:134 stop:703 length:570 start_codon:yes stop_codon:yes gene_type:complete
MHKLNKNIVSFDSERLILVDSLDNEIGTMSKIDCHQGEGRLHRAFSVFLFNAKGELLIQQRSALKKLWPLFWSNSCCSHPREGENITEAVNRRLLDELGIEAVDLEYIYKFSYTAKYKDVGSENELCHVFIGKIDQKIEINLNEIADFKFLNSKDITTLLKREDIYTPWFIMEWERINSDHSELLKTSP